MTFLVLLGAPGAGKGTQAAILSERLAIPHVATGDLFRSAVREGSAIGLEARRFMERGQLVPDDITVRMLLARLAEPDAGDGVILDGFPRTAAQAAALDQALDEHGARVDTGARDRRPVRGARPTDVRTLDLRGERPRLQRDRPIRPRSRACATSTASRLIQREDDRVETIRARLDQQLGAMREVDGHYRDQGILRTVDGRRSIDEVAADLLALVGRPVPEAAPDGRHPEVAGRDRPDAAGRPGRRRGPRPRRVGAPAGRVDGSSRRPRRGAHPTIGRHPVVQGLPGGQSAPAVPGQRLHLDRRRDRPRHPRRPDRPRGPGRVDRRGRHRRRLARRRGPDVLRRHARPRRSARSSTRPAWR